MSESREATIERLMEEGLNQYAVGDDARAMECWSKVLELDPEHAEATDYLRTASEGVEEEPAADAQQAPAEKPDGVAGSLLDAALGLLRAGTPDEALEMLETVVRTDANDLEAQAWLEMTRCELLERYRRRLCDGIAVPQLRVSADEIGRFNLPASAERLLAAVDGVSPVNEMLEGSGLDPFEGLRVCCRLIDAGLIEVHP